MTSDSPRQLRTDIQALRGFAVLIVIFYHAKISIFAGGYLGVDVFFVISGFLITRLIRNGIDEGRFSFSAFYFRRAKRLLPAAYVTFLVTALLSPLFLTMSELEDLRAQMVGAITFTANIVLWNQSGYFFGAAELKPLLHIWSLSIEEQYYFILPAMMVFFPRRFWLRGAILVLFISLTLCCLLSGQESTFYLLPTRAWELMIGSVGALITPGNRLVRLQRLLFWPALAVLLVLPLVKFGAHPGPQAVLICLATLLVILRAHPLLLKGAGIQVLSRTGDMSYSLYLVHWPLFAFFNNVWIGERGIAEPSAIRVGLIALSLLLAYLLNRYVEDPFHHAQIKGNARILGGTLASSATLILLTFGIVAVQPAERDYAEVRRVPYGFAKSCNFEENFEPIPACRNADRPEILIWGDSYAMHLVPGLLGATDGAPSIVQATRATCGPLLGVSPMQLNGWLGEDWARDCIAFNDSVINYLQTTDSIRLVILSSPFDQYLDGQRYRLVKRLDDSSQVAVLDPEATEAVAGLRRTVSAVRALGKRVVVIAPPPAGGFDIGRCLERVETGLPVMGIANDCQFSIDAYRQAKGDVLGFLGRLPQEAEVPVIRFDDFLCDSRFCRTNVDGTFIYSDGGHLSHEGSILLTDAMSLVRTIEEAAR